MPAHRRLGLHPQSRRVLWSCAAARGIHAAFVSCHGNDPVLAVDGQFNESETSDLRRASRTERANSNQRCCISTLSIVKKFTGLLAHRLPGDLSAMLTPRYRGQDSPDALILRLAERG